MVIKTVNIIDPTETAYPVDTLMFPKIKIKLKNPNAIMCPAAILAKSRTISTNGLVNTPTSSTTGIKGTGIFSHQGTPGELKICFQ